MAERIYETIYHYYWNSLAGIPNDEYQNLVDYIHKNVDISKVEPDFREEMKNWTGAHFKECLAKEHHDIYQVHKEKSVQTIQKELTKYPLLEDIFSNISLEDILSKNLISKEILKTFYAQKEHFLDLFGERPSEVVVMNDIYLDIFYIMVEAIYTKIATFDTRQSFHSCAKEFSSFK